jgi:hypothetical protein
MKNIRADISFDWRGVQTISKKRSRYYRDRISLLGQKAGDTNLCLDLFSGNTFFCATLNFIIYNHKPNCLIYWAYSESKIKF